MNRTRPIPAHRKLIVWHKSMDLATECHSLAAQLPPYERYELCSQMRRAAVSVYSNIAEGTGKRTRAEFSTFLAIARGSAMEVDSHTEYAMRVGYLKGDDIAQSLALEVILMSSSMMNRFTPFQSMGR